MARILETKLPFAQNELSPEIFNRLVRILELSLNKVDIGSLDTFSETQRNSTSFETGALIFNISTNQIQLWTGDQWVDIYTGTEKGIQATAAIGNITVSVGGNTVISIT